MAHTLKGKISLVYVGLVGLIAVVGAVSAVNLVLLQRSVKGLMNDNYISISAMEDARAALNEQKYAVLSYLDLNGEAGINAYGEQDEAFQTAFETERRDVTEPGEQAVVDAIVADYAELRRRYSVFEHTRDTKGKDAATAYYTATLKPQFDKVSTGLDRITTLNQTAMFNKKSAVAESAGTSLLAILALSLIAVLGGFLLSRYLVNRFLGPVHLLTQSISRVRAGGLDIRLDIKTGDETEKLIHEFNEMVSRLSAYEKSTMGSLMDERNKSVAIVKSISDPLIVLDGNYKIVMTNGACERFFEFDEPKALGRHFLEAIRDGELFSFITESMESPDAVSEKVLHFDKGNGCYFNVVVTKNIDDEHNVRNCVVLMQNVTGFKELERIKTDFVATVSHEFKTPLTSIIMGASMLEGGNLGALSGEQREVVGTIIEDGDKLSGFVNELLEVSKLESGRAVYSFEPCAVGAIVERSVRQFSETAQRENVAIVNDVDEDLPPVYADFERVTWVLNNLLGNALKYTKSGDTITISAKVSGGFIETFVRDTGDGIPPEYLDRIFDKFVQVNGHDIEARGTGLGLAVAKEIVTANGGRIGVESEMDVGSTFHFTLPLFRSDMINGEAN